MREWNIFCEDFAWWQPNISCQYEKSLSLEAEARSGNPGSVWFFWITILSLLILLWLMSPNFLVDLILCYIVISCQNSAQHNCYPLLTWALLATQTKTMHSSFLWLLFNIHSGSDLQPKKPFFEKKIVLSLNFAIGWCQWLTLHSWLIFQFFKNIHSKCSLNIVRNGEVSRK